MARRRVPGEYLEDVVQDALRVVYEKGFGADPDADPDPDLAAARDTDATSDRGPVPVPPDAELPGMAWCFQVLRNTIGNFYQKQATRSAVTVNDGDVILRTATAGELSPIESIDADHVGTIVLDAIESLDRGDTSCARYLRRLVEGSSPAELAVEEALDAAVLYRRIYRCRQKLRALLAERGVQV